MATVNYFPFISGELDVNEPFAPDMTSLDIVPYEYDMSYTSSRCPAQKEHHRNTWTIKCPFDIAFDVWPKQQNITVGDQMSTEAFKKVMVITPETWGGSHPEIQIALQYLFWTDTPNVWVETVNTMDMAKRGVELVEGTFCISAWSRPVNIGARLHNDKFFFPKGMDLSHIRLIDRNGHGNINLVKQDKVPQKVLDNMDQGVKYTTFFPFKSWSLIKKRVKNGFRIS